MILVTGGAGLIGADFVRERCAEHVDRSVHGPAEIVATHVVGTFTLLDAARSSGRVLS